MSGSVGDHKVVGEGVRSKNPLLLCLSSGDQCGMLELSTKVCEISHFTVPGEGPTSEIEMILMPVSSSIVS